MPPNQVIYIALLYINPSDLHHQVMHGNEVRARGDGGVFEWEVAEDCPHGGW